MKHRATRAELDQIAWNVIKAASGRTSAPPGYAKCGRPSNYVELGQLIEDRDGDFAFAWSEFLHEFYRYRQSGFFAEPPPALLSPNRRAHLAGVAEYLSREFSLPVPAWTEEPDYFLSELWSPPEDLGLDTKEFEEEFRAKSHAIFLQRNVAFASRDLIVL